MTTVSRGILTIPAGSLPPDEGARLLGDWGFLAHPDLPDQPGPAYLIVAIRDRPTLRHYDPEAVEFWRTIDGHGRLCSIDRATPLPLARRFSWGGIRMVDRVQAANEYVTFGGIVEADEVGDATVAVFTSPVPLLRRGGHSQLVDRAATDVAAFFARLLVAVEEQPGFEARVGEADPTVLYAAFLEEAARRLARGRHLAAVRSHFAALVRGERARIGAESPAEVAAARDLLDSVGFLGGEPPG